MTHPTTQPEPSFDAIPMRRPAAWVLRGDPCAIARARKNRLSVHARRD
jgi:hypothetical protein